MLLHRVRLVDGTIHAYRPSARQTLCGLDKQHEERVHGLPVECSDCIDKARAMAIRDTDDLLGLDAYQEVRF